MEAGATGTGMGAGIGTGAAVAGAEVGVGLVAAGLGGGAEGGRVAEGRAVDGGGGGCSMFAVMRTGDDDEAIAGDGDVDRTSASEEEKAGKTAAIGRDEGERDG